jgi:hypothetical protein
MLHSIVRSNDMVTDFLRDYFQHSLTYLDFLQRQGKNARTMVNPIHWAKAWIDGFKPTNGAVPPAAIQEEALLSRIQKLEERIHELEAKQPE